jgi:hypothetical protein
MRGTRSAFEGASQVVDEFGLFCRASTGSSVLMLVPSNCRRDIGAGKTCFARGFIRERASEPHLRVTSPSYLLDNTYEADAGQLMCVGCSPPRFIARCSLVVCLCDGSFVRDCTASTTWTCTGCLAKLIFVC